MTPTTTTNGIHDVEIAMMPSTMAAVPMALFAVFDPSVLGVGSSPSWSTNRWPPDDTSAVQDCPL